MTKRFNMDLSNPGITYILLVIPTLFALALTGQGIFKMVKDEQGGGVALSFGLICLVLIGATYFFFIQ